VFKYKILLNCNLIVNKSYFLLYIKNIILKLYEKINAYKMTHPLKYKFIKFNIIGVIKWISGGSQFFILFKLCKIAININPSDILIGLENFGWKKAVVIGTGALTGYFVYLHIDVICEIFLNIFKKIFFIPEILTDDLKKVRSNDIWDGLNLFNSNFNKLKSMIADEVKWKPIIQSKESLYESQLAQKRAIAESYARDIAYAKSADESNVMETADLMAQQAARDFSKRDYLLKIVSFAKNKKAAYIQSNLIELQRRLLNEEYNDYYEFKAKEAEIYSEGHALERQIVELSEWNLRNMENFAKSKVILILLLKI